MIARVCCPDCGKLLPPITDKITPFVCGGCGYKAVWINGVLRLLPSRQKNNTYPTGIFRPYSHQRIYEPISYMKTKLEKPCPIDINPFIAGKMVLDVGCGPNLRGVHRQDDVKAAGFYVGMDRHLPFLETNLRRNPGDSFLFVQGRAERLPFPDDAFDTTLALFLLHHVSEDVSRVFSEIWRVTREYCIIFDHIRSSVPAISCLQNLYWRITDGGFAYHQWDKWKWILRNHRLLEFSRSGPFGQVFRAVLCRK